MHTCKSTLTLIACLPNELKEILNKNEIIIATPNFKFPIFNYASFCRVLSTRRVHKMLKKLLRNNQQFISSHILSTNIDIVAQEIINLFIKQIPSLKQLDLFKFSQLSTWKRPTTHFISYPEAKVCLKNLSELHCYSNISSDFFFQLSQICHNILLLYLYIEEYVPNGLVDLISVQKSLKHFNIKINCAHSINSLMEKLPNTITKLNLYGGCDDISLSFITNLTNLKELQLDFYYRKYFKNLEILQNIIFPQLQILKFKCELLNCKLLIKFLKNNGINLREIYLCDHINYNNNSLNLSIAKFCPFLRKLSIGIKNNELETLKIIFVSCQYLESIKIWCGGSFLNEKEALGIVVNYSKNIYEIILDYKDDVEFEMLPEDLEIFFVNWSNCLPQRALSLVIIYDIYIINNLDDNDENMKIIDKYIKLGIIKKFKVTGRNDKEFNPYI
ncbi:hypothetical protein RclHR1_08870009 [Rhizophagus clarus]|uniref:F-box domain-containing protein n=1 Tax=Rhizophagus clarus TaxID=94130 RepID=A0A2Z6S2I6_9GLOM|nr:hypothetical protein RclHR1_08870009 [Rhizophagus clarus]GES91123.1 hypothetical protein GLOIN_2v1573959 [Rhizophagus clarus]